MAIVKDPALLPEERNEETVTDPQVTEDEGESAEKSTEGAGTGSDTTSSAETTDEKATETGGHDLVVAGEEPAPPKETPDKVKERNREFARLRARNTELERKALEREQATTPAAVDPGKKPTLEDCGYDTSDFETKLDAWHEAKRLKATADAQAGQEAQKAQDQRQQKQVQYLKSKEAIAAKLPDYEELEAMVAAGLSPVQRDVILHYTENPALVVAALGRSPERLQDFADTKDLGSLIAKAAKLEARTELKSKTTTPPPERPVRGTGSKTGGLDPLMEKLEREALRTGDRTPIADHLREQRRKAPATR